MRQQFQELLERASAELLADNPDRMSSGRLLKTPNPIDDRDLELFFAAIDAGLITLYRGGRFNTQDRPKPDGRWSLLSRAQRWLVQRGVPAADRGVCRRGSASRVPL